MRIPSTVASILTVAALVFASACSDAPPTQPLAALTAFDAAAAFSRARIGARPQSRDALFAEMAREIPGFGGLFYDEGGKLNIHMAPVDGVVMGEAEAAVALSDRLQGLGVTLAGVQQAIVLEGKYDFAQLYEWHQRLTPVLALQGVVLTDIDESRNRLQIGVEQGASAVAIEEMVARLGVPTEVVTVFESGPITLLGGEELTLRDRVRPVAGGLQTIRPGPPGSGFICTLGFNVRVPTLAPARDFFFTPSHCTAEIGSATGTPFYQQALASPDPANFIGIEVFDVPFAEIPGCSPGWFCRWSDAAVAQYEIPRAQVAFGRIMLPIPGTIVLPSPTSHLRIVGELPFPVVGQSLGMVGRTTGLTGGPVNLTCVTLQYPVPGNFALFCQDFVRTTPAGGDSGAPVGQAVDPLTGRINLAGMLWGGSSFEGGSFIYSAMSEIRLDYGFPAWITH